MRKYYKILKIFIFLYILSTTNCFADVVCYTEQCDPYGKYQDPYSEYQDPYSEEYIPSCTLTGAC